MPSIAELKDYKPAVSSRVYASDGRLVGRFGINRTFVPHDRIPRLVTEAFVAAEDQRFFDHGGVDPVAVGRAALTNVFGEDLVGGSTITQQVAKTFLLSSDRTMKRKLKEMLLALRIEQALSKERILELYLNQIYLGEGAYGVAAAAARYFDKPLSKLKVAEAAMLAALPKAPSRTNPIDNPLAAMQRRDWVVDRMREEGFITPEQASAAKAASYTLPNAGDSFDGSGRYFVETVRRSMVARYGSKRWKQGGFTVRTSLDRELQRHATETLRNGLVKVDRRHGYRGPVADLAKSAGAGSEQTWSKALARVERPAGAHPDWRLAAVLDVTSPAARIGFADGTEGHIPLAELKWARKQGKVRYGDTYALEPVGNWIGRASQVLSPGDVILAEAKPSNSEGHGYPEGTYTLRQVPRVTGALVALDPHTGRVRALVGGYSFDLSQFNMATQARRQPGSAFKPIVYLAALENGYTPSTLVRDAPVTLRTRWGKRYTPANYDNKFYGAMTARRALELSRNVATVRLSQRVGLEPIANLAERLGVIDAGKPRVLSLALGAYETTPLRMAAAYGAIANGGRRVTGSMIDRIQDRKGRTMYRFAPRSCGDCSEDRWQNQAMPTLRDAHERVVTAQSAYQLTQMLRGVIQRGTGTVVRGLDKPLAGKTGTTNDTADAWFVGYSPDLVVAVWVGHPDHLSLGPREQGGVTAAPIFKAFMKRALKGEEIRDFPRPSGLRAVKVAQNSGLPREHGRVITEYFKPGLVPKRYGAYAPDQDGYVAHGNKRNRNNGNSRARQDRPQVAQQAPVQDQDREHREPEARANAVDRPERTRRARDRRSESWVERRRREMDRYGR